MIMIDRLCMILWTSRFWDVDSTAEKCKKDVLVTAQGFLQGGWLLSYLGMFGISVNVGGFFGKAFIRGIMLGPGGLCPLPAQHSSVRYPFMLEASATDTGDQWSVMRSRSSRLSYRRIISATHLTYSNSRYHHTALLMAIQ